MSKTSNNVRLGIFVVLGVVILIGFVFYIGANQSLFGHTTVGRTYFRNISGLQVGANVRFSGINIGTVEAIRIATDTTVEVDFRVDNGAAKYLKKDSRVVIGSDGIMGDKVVNLTNGSIDAERFSSNDILPSDEPMEMDAIIAKATEMADELNTITANVADITSAIREGRGTIGMLLYDDATAERTRKMLTGVNKTIGNLNENLENVKGGTEAFTENMKAVQSNFLLRGYFKKKKEKEEEEKEKKRLEELKKAGPVAIDEAVKKDELSRREARKLKREMARARRRAKKEQVAEQKEN